jgi:hypothetical protein
MWIDQALAHWTVCWRPADGRWQWMHLQFPGGEEFDDYGSASSGRWWSTLQRPIALDLWMKWSNLFHNLGSKNATSVLSHNIIYDALCRPIHDFLLFWEKKKKKFKKLQNFWKNDRINVAAKVHYSINQIPIWKWCRKTKYQNFISNRQIFNFCILLQ